MRKPKNAWLAEDWLQVLDKMSNTIKSPKWRTEIYIPRYWGVRDGSANPKGTKIGEGQNAFTKKVSDIAETIGETERTTKRGDQRTKWNFDFGCGNRKSSAHYANLKTTAE